MQNNPEGNPALSGNIRLRHAWTSQEWRLVPGRALLHEAWRWWRAERIVKILLGIALRPSFQRGGIVEVVPGWPFPSISNHGQIVVGNCVFFPGVRIECWPGGHISIGTGTYLDRHAAILAGGAVTIGRNCKIARDVLIMDSYQHPLTERGRGFRPIMIGDNVWIGSRAIILGGVTLGSGCLVAAGAVVTSDVPPHAVAVGQHAHELSRQRSA